MRPISLCTYLSANAAHLLSFTVKDKYGDAAAMQMLNDGGEESSSTSESEDEGDVSSKKRSNFFPFSNGFYSLQDQNLL